MNRQMILQMLCVAAFAVFLANVAAPLVSADSIKIVVPNHLEFVEGDMLGVVSDFGPFRQQTLQLASEFVSLPETHHILTGFYNRPDHTVTQPSSASYDDLVIRVSTITASELTNDFTANYGGAPVTTVFDGPLTISTQATGDALGPRGFDYHFPFQTPYVYDPSVGNLLVEIASNSGPDGDLILDTSASSSALYVGASGANAATGFARHITVPGQFEFLPEPLSPCDFDGSGDCDVHDLNALLQEGPVATPVSVTPGVNDQYDLTGDGFLSNADVDVWLADAAAIHGLASPYLRGDANLDGVVEVSDFNDWNSAKFTSTLLWSNGNFDGDGATDVSDFNLWNANKFTSSDSTSAVPEPAAIMLIMLGAFLLRVVAGRRNN